MTVFPDDKTNLEDLERFMAFVEKEPAQASMFSEYYVFKGTGDIWHWHKPAKQCSSISPIRRQGSLPISMH